MGMAVIVSQMFGDASTAPPPLLPDCPPSRPPGCLNSPGRGAVCAGRHDQEPGWPEGPRRASDRLKCCFRVNGMVLRIDCFIPTLKQPEPDCSHLLAPPTLIQAAFVASGLLQLKPVLTLLEPVLTAAKVIP